MNYEKMFLDKYNYLYSNIDFITRPHMSIVDHYEPEMLKAIENLLLSCDELENNYGYKYIEELKNNPDARDYVFCPTCERLLADLLELYLPK